MINKSLILCLLASSLLLVACNQQEPTQQNTETAASSATVKTVNSEVVASHVSASETVAASSEQDALESFSSAFTAFGTIPNRWHFFVQPKEDGTNRLQMLAEGGVVNGEFEVKRSVYAHGVEFSGKHGGETVNLNISRAACEDPDSGQNYEFKAVLDFGGVRYQGCALLEIMTHTPT